MPIPAYRLVETSPPATEPLTLEETKLHLRVTHDAEDDLISGLIAAARQMCEQATGLALIERDYSLYLDAWPAASSGAWWDGVREGGDVSLRAAELSLPRPPLASVALINVYDADGNAEEFPVVGYFVDTAGLPGRVVLKNGAAAPSPRQEANGIEVQFTAGYGTAPDDVPPALRQGMRQIVAHLYENRGDAPEAALKAAGAEVLFQPFRLMRLA